MYNLLQKGFIMKTAVFILAFFLVFTPISLGAQEYQELTIMTENWPPFNYEEDGELTGISVEIVREIMKRLDLSYDILLFPWARGYDYIQKNDNHVLFSMAYSEERAPMFKWVGPIADFRISLYARPDFEMDIQTLDDAKKVGMIGVPRDSLPHMLLKNMEFENLLPLSGAETMLRMLYNRRVDLICGSNLALQNMPADIPHSLEYFDEVIVLKRTYLNIAFSLNVLDSTIEKWQRILDEMIADGTIDAIKAKY